jgi:metal-responsive CopG/Arc/MetJ family transcriptional regulator
LATDKPRYSITVEPELLAKIEDYRYANRIPTRAEATVELIRIALETIERQNSNSAERR